jgi:hypothetical protein
MQLKDRVEKVTASNEETGISVMTTEPIKMPLKVAFSAYSSKFYA